MATYQKRGTAWRALIRRKGYPTLTATFDTKAEATKWASGIEGDMSRSKYVDSSKAEQTTLAAALTTYTKISDAKKGAKQEAVRIKRWLLHPLSEKYLSAITSSDLATYRDERLKQNVATATVRLELAIISHLFTIAAKEWHMTGLVNPCTNIRLPKGSKERDRRPTTKELQKICEAANAINRELPIIIELAADTAMRRTELVMLRREQIRGRVAYFEDSKNGSRRAVPLSTRALELLKSLPARIDGRVFSLSPQSVSNYFPRACVTAGVVNLHYHDLRHEATSRLFERGLDIMEVAAITGHKTLAMLKRYTHLSPENLADKLA
jgi:integrase